MITRNAEMSKFEAASDRDTQDSIQTERDGSELQRRLAMVDSAFATIYDTAPQGLPKTDGRGRERLQQGSCGGAEREIARLRALGPRRRFGAALVVFAGFLALIFPAPVGAAVGSAVDAGKTLGIQIDSPSAGARIEPGQPMIIRAAVTWGGKPLGGAPSWYARASIHGPGGTRIVTLMDDGRTPDVSAGDGVWSAHTAALLVPGDYTLRGDIWFNRRHAVSSVVAFTVAAAPPAEPARTAIPAIPAPAAQAPWRGFGASFAGALAAVLLAGAGFFALGFRRHSAAPPQPAAIQSLRSDLPGEAGSQLFIELDKLVAAAHETRKQAQLAHLTETGLREKHAVLRERLEKDLEFGRRLAASAEGMKAFGERIRKTLEEDSDG